MKVLCPTDFSECSVNAIKWIIQLLETNGSGEIEILHCISFRKRSDVFIRLENVLEEQAIQDMNILLEVLKDLTQNVKITSNITLADPRTYIVNRSQIINADFVLLGSTGLTSLKDITVGSITEFVAKKSEIPILVIPEGTEFKVPKRMVFGLDKEVIKEKVALEIVQDFMEDFKLDLKAGQVLDNEGDEVSIDEAYYDVLGIAASQVKRLNRDGKISKVLHQFAKEENADICAVVHHKLNWFGRLLHHSVTKDELFDLEIPLLIIPD